MTARHAAARPLSWAAPAQRVTDGRVEVAPPVPRGGGDLADRAPAGEWGPRLVTVLVGWFVDRHPDVALTFLRSADELADNGRGRVQRLICRPVRG